MPIQVMNSQDRQTFIRTTTLFIMTKVSSFAKIFIYGVAWAKYLKLVDHKSPTAGRIAHTGTIVKLSAAGFCEAPEKLRVIGTSISDFAHQRTRENAKKVFWSFNDAVNPVVDSRELLHVSGIAPVSEVRFTLYKKINGVSMLLGFGKLTKESLQKYWEARRTVVNSPEGEHYLNKEKWKQVFECAKAVSYFVLGLLICASLFLGIVAPGVAFSIAATSALVFTILGFYNDEWRESPAPKRNWMALAAAAT